jgi:hypothetical protein
MVSPAVVAMLRERRTGRRLRLTALVIVVLISVQIGISMVSPDAVSRLAFLPRPPPSS